MTPNEQKLVNALRAVILSHNKTSVVAAALVLEEVCGVSTDCPKCQRSNSVAKGYVKIHFARVTDARPCSASFKNVVGGILL